MKKYKHYRFLSEDKVAQIAEDGFKGTITYNNTILM